MPKDLRYRVCPEKKVLFLLRTRNLAYITAINKKITSYSGLDEVG